MSSCEDRYFGVESHQRVLRENQEPVSQWPGGDERQAKERPPRSQSRDRWAGWELGRERERAHQRLLEEMLQGIWISEGGRPGF